MQLRLTESELPSDRRFGFFVTAVAVGVSIWLRVHLGMTAALPVLVLAGVCGLAALVRPSALRPFNRAWMSLGLLLGYFVSPIVMGLVFFGLFTPLAALLRLAGRDELRLKAGRGGTFWLDRNPPGPPPESFKRQY